MAYAAAISLMQILKRLDQLLIPYPKFQIQSLNEKVSSLQSFLKENNLVPNSSNSNSTSTVHDLEKQTIDAICEAEDIIESHISTHFLLSENEDEVFTHKLLKLLQRFDSIKETALEIADRGSKGPSPIRSSQPFGLTRSFEGKKKLVGREVDLMKLKDQLTGHSSRTEAVALVGMIGIGKTALVNEVYDDLSISHYFEYRGRAIIGQDYNVRDILLGLLNLESCPDNSDDELAATLYRKLMGRRFLIVLEDVNDVEVWGFLKRFMPDNYRGSRIILTTRQMRVAHTAATGNVHEVRFLDVDQSWDLLRYTAIGEASCSTELVKIGKTIAQDCQGLPQKIIVLGRLLADVPPNPERWSIIADDRNTQNRELLKVMQNSDHEQLPQHIRACFLYMVAFPQYQKIPVSKLFKLWVAEGFLELNQLDNVEEVGKECLMELVQRSLVMEQRSSTSKIKTCSIHSALWPFINHVASEHKIINAIDTYENGADPSHRRFSIHKNILFAIKDVHKSITSVPTIRSFLCTGPYHPYPLQVSLAFSMLRVLDALNLRFYKFPVEILKIVLLRFLAITLNRGELPASVSNLRELQFLIVRRISSIKSSGPMSVLPMEIWNMKELRHLQVMGGDIPPPSDLTGPLSCLSTLSNVSAFSCSREVFERTPNLKELGIRIDLDWEASAPPLHIFDHLSHLHQLETFKCVVMNPILGNQVASPPYSVSAFPSSIKKLTLSGCGFSWVNIKIVSKLPKLEEMKLRCHAFRGSQWEVNDDEFCSLRFLLLEDMDIEHWKANDTVFPNLERLSIEHCYRLDEIPLQFGDIPTLETIELVDCSPSAVVSAMQIKEEQLSVGNELLQVITHSSWTDHNLKK